MALHLAICLQSLALFCGDLSFRQNRSNWRLTALACKYVSDSQPAAPLVKVRVTRGACLSSKLLRSLVYWSWSALTVLPGLATNEHFLRSHIRLCIFILWYLRKVIVFDLGAVGLAKSSWPWTTAWSEKNPPTRTLETTFGSVGARTRSRMWPSRWVGECTCCAILHESRQFKNLVLSMELVSTWMLKSLHIRNEELTEERYSKRLRNLSKNSSEHEPGGR